MVDPTLGEVAKVVRAVLWPLVSIVSILLFREPISYLIRRVSKIHTAVVDVEANVAVIKEAAGATTAILISDLRYSDAQAFDKVDPWLDQEKTQEAIDKWAVSHSVKNPSDMGPKNFQKCLFDLGLPGGEDMELEYDGTGRRRRLKYQ
jgi:hypothetical protein